MSVSGANARSGDAQASPGWVRELLSWFTAGPLEGSLAARAGAVMPATRLPPPHGRDRPEPGMMPLVYTIHGRERAGASPLLTIQRQWLRLPAELLGVPAGQVPGALAAVARRRSGWGLDPLPCWPCWRNVRGVVVVWEQDAAPPAGPGKDGAAGRGPGRRRAAGTPRVRAARAVVRPGFSDMLVRDGGGRGRGCRAVPLSSAGPAAAGLDRLLSVLREVERSRVRALPGPRMRRKGPGGRPVPWMTTERRTALSAVVGAPGPVPALDVCLETGMDRFSAEQALKRLATAGLITEGAGLPALPRRGESLFGRLLAGSPEPLYSRVCEPGWYARGGLLPAWECPPLEM